MGSEMCIRDSTGAIVIGLGEKVSGVMSNNDEVASGLFAAGQSTHERVWQMPMYEEYGEQLKSHIADLNNIGGRPAGSITAGKFLEHFVGKVPWAHVDIAGTSFLDKASHYHPQGATGFGVRLMVDYLRSLES